MLALGVLSLSLSVYAWVSTQTDANLLTPEGLQQAAQLCLDICEDQGIRGHIFDLMQVEPMLLTYRRWISINLSNIIRISRR